MLLVVDDDPAIHDYLDLVLSAHGYRLIHASNGAEALGCYQSRQPDLILTDVVMPEHGGVALIYAVRAIDPLIPIVAMSALPSSNLAMVEKIGANALIHKPLEISPLITVIAGLCQLCKSTGMQKG